MTPARRRLLMVLPLVVGGILLLGGAAYTAVLLAQPPRFDVVPDRELAELQREAVLDRWLTFAAPIVGGVLVSFGTGVAVGDRVSSPAPVRNS